MKPIPAKVQSLNQAEVEQAAKTVVHPQRLVWLVVGDRSKIESGLRDLGLGQMRVIDAAGKPVGD